MTQPLYLKLSCSRLYRRLLNTSSRSSSLSSCSSSSSAPLSVPYFFATLLNSQLSKESSHNNIIPFFNKHYGEHPKSVYVSVTIMGASWDKPIASWESSGGRRSIMNGSTTQERTAIELAKGESGCLSGLGLVGLVKSVPQRQSVDLSYDHAKSSWVDLVVINGSRDLECRNSILDPKYDQDTWTGSKLYRIESPGVNTCRLNFRVAEDVKQDKQLEEGEERRLSYQCLRRYTPRQIRKLRYDREKHKKKLRRMKELRIRRWKNRPKRKPKNRFPDDIRTYKRREDFPMKMPKPLPARLPGIKQEEPSGES